jgi:Asp-tRNA(Asn)/Glu-tRNA(Gln) amidotransferase A subunit family amidase
MINLQIRKESNFEYLENKILNLSADEITEYYLEYIENYIVLDNKYGFNESMDKNFIIDQIKNCESQKKLSYMPFGIKDVFNTKVLPTSMGSQIWKGFKAGNNARVIDNLVSNGGIIFSKTTTAEFAVHFITPGKTKNPYNINHITGTSSSGSAVAVACGALPIALGTQTAGSIIRPASFCGVYGFKPSFGSIDRTGVLKTNDTFDTIGLLSADIHGIKKTFYNIFQKGRDYPYSINFFENFSNYNKNFNKLKIGILDNSLNVFKNFTNVVMSDFELVKKTIEENYELREIKSIDFLNEIHPIHEEMYAKSLSYYFQNEIKQNESISDIMLEMIKKGENITAENYVKISKLQPVFTNKMNEIFKQVDFIIVPSTASSAPKVGNNEIDDTCLIWTFLGYPSVTIPLFTDDNNLPFGLQVISKKFDDFALLEFSEKLQKIFY